MIARIIEAKPEELRVFLEEAAGVSKYKERRRETENRLHDTRENLTRVEDIVRELGANLEKLEAQAVVATKYKELVADGEEKQRLLWLLRKNEAAGEQQKQQRAIEQAQIDLDAQTAKLREVEAQLETLRVAHYSASDAMQGAQGALYEANAEVSRLEAEIKFIVESRNRVQAQIAALNAQREQWRAQAEKAQDELEEAEEARAIADEKAAWPRTRPPPSMTRCRRSKRNGATRRRSSTTSARIAQTEQSLKLEAAHQRNADQQLQQLQQRHERLKSEAGGLDAPDEAQLEELRMQLAEQEEVLAEAQARLADAQETLPRLDGERRAAHERVQAERADSPARGAPRRAQAAAGERADRRQDPAVARQARARRAAAAVEEAACRSRLGSRARSRAARAPRGARSVESRLGEGVRHRCAAREARVLRAARCGRAAGRRSRAAPGAVARAHRRCGHPCGAERLARQRVRRRRRRAGARDARNCRQAARSS
jgi:chromosome segregation ATPase